jgi:hypothetical protein
MMVTRGLYQCPLDSIALFLALPPRVVLFPTLQMQE